MRSELLSLDSTYQSYILNADWQSAVENRVQAAAVAAHFGELELVQSIADEAVDLACSHKLYLWELYCRIFRYLHLLETSSQNINELRVQLDYSVRLNGELPDLLRKYYRTACSSYKKTLRLFNLATQGALPAALLGDAIARSALHAHGFSLSQVEGQLLHLAQRLMECGEVAKIGDDLRSAAQRALLETKAVYKSLKINLLLNVALFKLLLDDSETASEILSEAEGAAQHDPASLVQVNWAWAQFYLGTGQLRASCLRAEMAQQAAESMQPGQSLEVQTPSVEAQSPRLNAPPHMSALLRRMNLVAIDIMDGRFDEALNKCELALAEVKESGGLFDHAVAESLFLVLTSRAQVYLLAGRLYDAEADIDACIALLSSQLPSSFDSWLMPQTEKTDSWRLLFRQKAWIRAKKKDFVGAWNLLERGRSRSLKPNLPIASRDADPLPKHPEFGPLRNWLVKHRAAVLTFSITTLGTMVLSAGPGEAEPHCKLLTDLTSEKLVSLLGIRARPNHVVTTSDIFDLIGELSNLIVRPLKDRLNTLSRSANVLYIIPDSHLYLVPFSVLKIEEDKTLIDIIPLAIIPSIGALLWTTSRRHLAADRSCLAMAVGTSGKYDFTRHLEQIASAPWPSRYTKLTNEFVTIDAMATEAANYDVLYISCHGELSLKAPDPMQASRLRLENEQVLTAKELLGWPLKASLVFLNACQSARFFSEDGTEVNGLLRAFFLAGARSVIGTIAHVSPTAAGDLATVFFQSWLRGNAAAEALRLAQLNMRERGYPAHDWGGYFILGDAS